MPIAEISRATKLTEKWVRQTIDLFTPFFRELPNLERYQGIKTKVLESAELAVLKSIVSDQEKLDKAQINHLASALKEISSLRRLESGLSTQNVNQQVHHLKR